MKLSKTISSESDLPQTDCAVNLRLAGRLCVVVGGGEVGVRKVERLLQTGARVRLIEPAPGAKIESDRLELVRRPYVKTDLIGAFLVVAATDKPELNADIAADARKLGALVSLVDDPAASDFTLPAVRQLGDLRLAVSTNGRSPALAALLAEELVAGLDGWELALQIASCLRGWYLTGRGETAYNRPVLRQLIEGGLVKLLQERRFEAVDRLLIETCGAGCSLAALGLHLPEGL